MKSRRTLKRSAILAGAILLAGGAFMRGVAAQELEEGTE